MTLCCCEGWCWCRWRQTKAGGGNAAVAAWQRGLQLVQGPHRLLLSLSRLSLSLLLGSLSRSRLLLSRSRLLLLLLGLEGVAAAEGEEGWFDAASAAAKGEVEAPLGDCVGTLPWGEDGCCC